MPAAAAVVPVAAAAAALVVAAVVVATAAAAAAVVPLAAAVATVAAAAHPAAAADTAADAIPTVADVATVTPTADAADVADGTAAGKFYPAYPPFADATPLWVAFLRFCSLHCCSSSHVRDHDRYSRQRAYPDACSARDAPAINDALRRNTLNRWGFSLVSLVTGGSSG